MNIRNPGQDGAGKGSAPENTGAGKASPVHMYRVSLLILFFMMGSVFGSWASRIPDIKRALSLSDGALGLALFAAPTGEFAAVAVAALLIKRWGSQAVILAGLPCYAVCLTGLGLAPSLPFLAAALFLFGFASNTFNIALNAQAVDVECLYKRPIMSTFHGMWSLGGVAGGTLGAIVAPLGLPPLPHFIIMCAVTCLVTFSVRHRILPHDLPRKFTPKKHRGFTMPSCFILLLGFIAFSNMATEGTMYDWSAVYFAQVVRPGEALVRAGYIACMICMVCCRFIADRLVVRFGAIRVLQFGGLCTAAGFLLACLVPTLPAATAGFAMVGFGMAPVIPLCYSLTSKSRTVSPSVAISIISTISFFGMLASPAGVGMLSHVFGLQTALMPLAAMGLSIIVLAPLLARAERNQ